MIPRLSAMCLEHHMTETSLDYPYKEPSDSFEGLHRLYNFAEAFGTTEN